MSQRTIIFLQGVTVFSGRATYEKPGLFLVFRVAGAAAMFGEHDKPREGRRFRYESASYKSSAQLAKFLSVDEGLFVTTHIAHADPEGCDPTSTQLDFIVKM